MTNLRIQKFTQTIVDALDIVEDDMVLVWSNEGAASLVLELQKEILKRLAFPNIRITLEQGRYNLYKYGQEKHLTYFPPGLAREIELATKLISIDCVYNPNQIRHIAQEKINLWKRTAEPYQRRLDFIPTLVTIFPNSYYANQAGMSLEEYENLFYNAVSIDLDKLYDEYRPIEQLLSRGERFEIKTSNTDLVLELGDRNFTLNSLLINLPDGELFCSPMENSVNGYIRFEHPQCYLGKTFRNLYLEFQNGKVTDFRAETEKSEMKKLLETDEGACKIGEFGIGINPAIPDFTHDILFDEKIAGTIHFALGHAHPEAGGTNRSAIHFDIVKDMRGDGEIIMDERVVYRAGKFCTY
jgi:aminopeptidase